MKLIFRIFLFSSVFGLELAKPYVSLLITLHREVNRSHLQTKYTSFKCSGSGRTVTNLTCGVKSYSRESTVLNLAFNVIKQIDQLYVRNFTFVVAFTRLTHFQIEYTLFYRQLGNFRQVIKTPKLELCELIKNVFQEGPFNNMVRVLLAASSNAIKPCPYPIGPFQMFNYSGKKANMSFAVIPNGEYKTTLKFSNDDDDNIGTTISKLIAHERSDLQEF